MHFAQWLENQSQNQDDPSFWIRQFYQSGDVGTIGVWGDYLEEQGNPFNQLMKFPIYQKNKIDFETKQQLRQLLKEFSKNFKNQPPIKSNGWKLSVWVKKPPIQPDTPIYGCNRIDQEVKILWYSHLFTGDPQNYNISYLWEDFMLDNINIIDANQNSMRIEGEIHLENEQNENATIDMQMNRIDVRNVPDEILNNEFINYLSTKIHNL